MSPSAKLINAKLYAKSRLPLLLVCLDRGRVENLSVVLAHVKVFRLVQGHLCKRTCDLDGATSGFEIRLHWEDYTDFNKWMRVLALHPQTPQWHVPTD